MTPPEPQHFVRVHWRFSFLLSLRGVAGRTTVKDLACARGMRAGPAEIRWHSTQPIYSVDFSAIPADEYRKQHNPYERAAKSEGADLQAWRLATAGGDNQVRIWLVTPTPHSVVAPKAGPSGSHKAADPAKVEYLTTLSKHQAVVNCVRFSPFGSTLASASDDGTIILWQMGEKQAKEAYGTDLADELAYAREFWKVKRVMRFTQQEVYDIAWSPDGEMLVAGSTDNTARICRVSDGTCVQQITDHNNYVQGVAWDPLNNFIATQSSDRHMHVYGLKYSAGHGSLSISLVGKNSRLDLRQQRGEQEHGDLGRNVAAPMTSSLSNQSNEPATSTSSHVVSNGQHAFRPPPPRRSESRQSDSDRSESGSTAMRPPAPGAAASTRRTSFSGSPPAPAQRRLARSPSPVPPLPAIRPPSEHPSPQPSVATPVVASPPAPSAVPPPVMPLPRSANISLFGGQEVSPFFRRLAWSTDGSLLLTPAGLFADPFSGGGGPTPAPDGQPPPKKRRKGTDADGTAASATSTESKSSDAKPTVYIYTRTGVATNPVAHLPGHKTGTIAIRFNPILFKLRQPGGASRHVTLQNTVIDGETPAQPEPVVDFDDSSINSVFRLPHRMVYAVATHDSVLVYDTQQSTPLCYFGNLHYAPFTDIAWSADGHTLVLASQDGYCSLVAFSKGELGEPLPDEARRRRPEQPIEALPQTAPPSAPASEMDKTSLDAARADATPEANKVKKRKVALTFEGPLG